MKIFRVAVALAINQTLISLAAAGTISWNFYTQPYYGSEPPIVYGVLTTSDTFNSRGQYEIVSVSGYFGNDSLLNISTRPGFHADTPDNTISFNLTDISAHNGCSNWSYFPVNIGSFAHFSCAGVAFETDKGVINLSFAGATEVLVGYDGAYISNTRTQFVQTVPEPGTVGLFLAGLTTLLIRRRLQDRKAIGINRDFG